MKAELARRQDLQLLVPHFETALDSQTQLQNFVKTEIDISWWKKHPKIGKDQQV